MMVANLPRSLFRKIIIWSLLLICCGSFGSGYSRAVICFEQNGTVELRHKNKNGHCPNKHSHSRVKIVQPKSVSTASIASRPRCSGCDDFEIPLQLSAPRNEPCQKIADFIASPQLTAGIQSRPWSHPQLSSSPPSQPVVPDDPSFTHLHSIILLI